MNKAHLWASGRLLALLSISLIVACGSGSMDSPGFTMMSDDELAQESLDQSIAGLCDELSGGDSTVEFTADPLCLNCSASDESHAIDGQHSSFSSVEFASGSDGPWTVLASAQDGVVFAAGSNAAVVLSAPEKLSNLTAVVTTYLDGIEQESECEPSFSLDENSRVVIGTRTTQPYNAVELLIKRNHLELADTSCGLQVLSPSNVERIAIARSVRIHEFCHEFRIPE